MFNFIYNAQIEFIFYPPLSVIESPQYYLFMKYVFLSYRNKNFIVDRKDKF